MSRNWIVGLLLALPFVVSATYADEPVNKKELKADREVVKGIRTTVKADKEQLKNDVDKFGKNSAEVEKDREKLKGDVKSLRAARKHKKEDRKKLNEIKTQEPAPSENMPK